MFDGCHDRVRGGILPTVWMSSERFICAVEWRGRHAEHPREDSEMSMERVLTMVAVVLGSVALVGCQPKAQEKVELPAAPVEQIAVEAEAVEAAAPAVPEQPPADKP